MPHDPAASNWSRRLQPECEGQDLATRAHSQSSPGDGGLYQNSLHSIELVTLKGGEGWRFSAAGAAQSGSGECGI
jgi:hypothetical protein